jgi:uncharacterized phage protein (TIGR01671 family)
MQYTGLKDKNGKEIFEGDILLFEMTRTVPVDHPVKTALQNETALYQGPIKWGQSAWRPFTDGADNRKCEIIGNIYETPYRTSKSDATESS